MRSETLMPLLQFVNWMGIDPWYTAGIDYAGVTNPSGYTGKSVDNQCICMPQHSWDADNHWSKDDLINALIMAEDFFVKEARYYPADYYIESERVANSINGVLGNSLTNSSGKLKSIKPKFACNFNSFGAKSLISNGDESLTRDDVGVIRDIFTLTATVPIGTLESEIRVYFTAADASYVTDPEFNEHIYEIRPVTVDLVGVTATITAPAYLFKKPSLDETSDCVYHVLTTYVEEVSVFIESVDSCSQGNYVCFNDNCDTTPCEETLSPVCFTKRTIGGQIWGVPNIAECNDSSVLVKYCLTCLPDEIEYNYTTGVQNSSGGFMDRTHVDVLSKLAIGLGDCDKKWCDCNYCLNSKTKFYKDAPRVRTEIGIDRQEYDNTWQVILSKESVEMLSGLPPRNGILQAIRFIGKNTCTSVEGAYL